MVKPSYPFKLFGTEGMLHSNCYLIMLSNARQNSAHYLSRERKYQKEKSSIQVISTSSNYWHKKHAS